jgi:hypothetical protein
MANWSNLRLVVTGRLADLRRFRRAAGALTGRIDTRRSAVFTEDMEYGEGGDLEADGLRRAKGRLRTASYRFQGRNTNYVDHFRRVARTFPALVFVLVYSDPNGDNHGSFLLHNRRLRRWTVPARTTETIHQHQYRIAGVADVAGEVDYDSMEADAAEWEAFWEIMDVAERKWDAELARIFATRRSASRIKPMSKR